MMINQQFYKFKLNVYEQKSMVKELMEAAGIQQGIDDYDAEFQHTLSVWSWIPTLRIFIDSNMSIRIKNFSTNENCGYRSYYLHHNSNYVILKNSVKVKLPKKFIEHHSRSTQKRFKKQNQHSEDRLERELGREWRRINPRKPPIKSRQPPIQGFKVSERLSNFGESYGGGALQITLKLKSSTRPKENIKEKRCISV